MRVEIDLPNPDGKIFSGMYAKVTIVLDEQKDVLSIPTGCLVGKRETDKAAVFIVRDGRAHLVSVQLGFEGSEHVRVLNGLTAKDQVILQPSKNLSDGDNVTPNLKTPEKQEF
jgi:multidrug efflux pump subunit AcrA (membrane-fusion protein)